MSVSLSALQFEHHESGFAIAHPTPRLSWRFAPTTAQNWTQVSYEISIARDGSDAEIETYKVASSQSVLVPWPSAAAPLKSRERATVKVRVTGSDGSTSDWAEGKVEVALLERDQWRAEMVGQPGQIIDTTKPPVLFRSTFDLTATPQTETPARLYSTAQGLYEVHINGHRIGDQYLAPGWTVYPARLRYQTYDIAAYLHKGKNSISAYIGEGWYAGRMGRTGARNLFGDRLGFMGQVEVGGEVVCASGAAWEWTSGPVTRSDIYDGEDMDSRLGVEGWQASTAAKGKVEVLPFPTGKLVSSDAPPVRKIMEVKAVDLITTPSGKKILDFGQNLVGWLRAEEELLGDEGSEVVIRHAEVLEKGELGVRPLRDAKATAHIVLGGPTKGWETKFTFFGFRYAEVTGVSNLSLSTFTAVVISSDMRRTGHFECSHDMINRLHENVIWSMRGNFVSVPTDCPQRDERLGWTGDIQVFAPTANYLFDTTSFLSEWLDDLYTEQVKHNGVVPFVIPNVPMRKHNKAIPHAVWADVTALLPRDLHLSSADQTILEKQFDSMVMWLDKGIPRGEDGLWDVNVPQFADWLDPRAPPQYPAHGLTDTHLVANAYLIHTTETVAVIAKLIGRDSEHERFSADALRFRQLFKDEYISPKGRLVSDSQTALALALKFELLEPKQRQVAAERLQHITRWWSFKISTGFAGTPIILPVLAENGYLGIAYRMLQEKDCPSWLYPVGMGATTIWERWDSMLEDGSINPGQMTSFNHYALGAVAAFLHNTVAGLSPLQPGWSEALIKPQPGGTITWAKTSYSSAYGDYAVEWKIEGGKFIVHGQVPANATAQVLLPGWKEAQSVGSGQWDWEVDWQGEKDWPMKQMPGPSSLMMPDEYVP